MRAWAAPDLSSVPAVPGEVRVFDTARGEVVPVGPAEGTARMYVCGITPYDATHLGHANTYVTFDLLNRVWRDAGLGVRYVQNVTDVDDPLLERADQTGVDWRRLAAEQVELFRSDMEALRVLPPDEYVGATEAIDLVTSMIDDLGTAGAVYAVDDEPADRYFSQASDASFGEVAHLDHEAALAVFADHGGDPERPGKRDPLDALLWRLERPGEPAWDSPYGAGRPGWHIECAAIALRHLGPDFDVQGGGSDLAFPHHEMSAAHARVATGQPFARAYVHSGMVALDGEKMSKSLGNLELVSRLRAAGVDPMAVRLALLAQHYRSDWEWGPAVLEAAERRLALWRDAITSDAGLDPTETLRQARAALRNDLDAPTALALIDTWAAATIDIDSDDAEAPARVAAFVDAVLGVALR